jgi:hypothetical protein
MGLLIPSIINSINPKMCILQVKADRMRLARTTFVFLCTPLHLNIKIRPIHTKKCLIECRRNLVSRIQVSDTNNTALMIIAIAIVIQVAE